METVKPRRWKTFRNAFSLYQRRHRKSTDDMLSARVRHHRRSADDVLSAGVTATHKKRSLFGHFRRRNNHHALTDMNSKPHLHSNRPLSMVDNTLTEDALDVLLDSKPSRSLPASPLAKRRNNPSSFCPSEELAFVDPTMTLETTLTTLSHSTPAVDFIGHPAEDFEYLPAPPPETFVCMHSPPASDGASGDGLVFTESSCNKSTDAVPDMQASVEVLTMDTEETACEENEALMPPVASQPPQETSRALDEAKSSCGIKYATWEAIREALSKDSDDKWSDVVPLSYDVLPKQDQSWLNASSGMEGLRVFLQMVD